MPDTPDLEEHTPDGKNRRCQRRSKNRDGAQCGGIAMRGQDVCHFHGGSSPQAKAKAKERLVEEKARKAVATYGGKIETTATEALLDEVQWTAGHVAWLRERVQEIEDTATGTDGQHPLVWGKTREKTGGQDWGQTEEATPNIWLRLYQEERDHLVKVSTAAIKAGIEERRVRLAEQQGQLVAQAIRAILDDLGLTVEQQAKVPEIVPRHLRALAS
ncbi:hypothetical protein ACFC8N_42865 [Streptomyces sp. NPDC055966]|uniref:hypothetical protein n=1 Tax=Streptomyces sp. NPDC055966 TaxID=3345669 RepID=UPI0035D52F89